MICYQSIYDEFSWNRDVTNECLRLRKIFLELKPVLKLRSDLTITHVTACNISNAESN